MALIPVSEKETVAVATKSRFTVVGREEVARVPRSAKYVPIVPTGNSCCPNICRNINVEIRKVEKELEERIKEISISATGHSKMKVRRQKYYLTNKLDVLEGFRVSMKDGKVCGCIKDVE